MADIAAQAARAAREVGIPPSLYVSLITRGERSYKGWQTSPSGAQGPAQLMPGTAAGIAHKYGIDTSTYYGNLLGGAYYLKEQLDHFKDPRLAVAAYNAGPGAVEKAGGVPGFVETQRYVKNVLGQVGKVAVPPPMPTPRSPDVTAQTPGTPGYSFKQSVMPDLTTALTGGLGDIATGEQKPTDLLGPLLKQALTPSYKTITVPGAKPPPMGESLMPMNGHTPPLRNTQGGAWDGTQAPVTHLGQIGVNMGLQVTSTKRDRKMSSSGLPSDHWTGSKNAYAEDLSGSPAEMDKAAQRIAAQLGVKYDGRSELVLSKVIDGMRYQILYRTNVGGNHWSHIHIGVKRVG